MNNLRLTILVKQFPKLSETFIEGEITSLVEKGFDIQIASLNGSSEAFAHDKSMHLVDRVTYLNQQNTYKCVVFLCLCLLLKPKLLIDRISEVFKSLENFLHVARLVYHCRSYRTEHIHAHYISEPSLIANLAAELIGIEFSISAHAKDIYLTNTKILQRRIARAKFVVTCTAHNLKYLRGIAKRNRDKVFLAYHGIDTRFFKPSKTESNKDNRKLIMSVGRFKIKKGFDVLIDACALLKKSRREFQCQIVGYGDQHALLSRKIEERGLQQEVELVKPMSHEKLVPILQSADLFVLPCRLTADGDRDGIPNAMLEAMACGIPVVSTRISGIPEVINSGENGLLVDPNDPEALAAAMMRVLDDEKYQKNLAAHGRATVNDKFSWGRNIQTLTELLLSQAGIAKPT